MTTRNRLLALVAVVLVVEAVSIVLGGWVDQLLVYVPGVDKVLHVAAFTFIFLVTERIVRDVIPDQRLRAAVVAGGVLLLAAGDELGQGLRADRDLDARDFIASVCGVGLGLAWTWRPVSLAVASSVATVALVAAGTVAGESYSTQRHLNAGVRYSRVGDFVSARREYRLAYEAGVRNAGLFNELGWVEIESGQGDPKVAVDFAAQALALRPENPDIQDTYGWALHHAGRSAEALPYLERAYAASPDMFCIHLHLGAVYLALGQAEKARRHLALQVERQDTREAARAAEMLARLPAAPGS